MCISCMFVYLSLQATLKLPLGDMLCSSDEAQLMRLLIELIKAKKVIEIGGWTFKKTFISLLISFFFSFEFYRNNGR